MSKVFRSIGWRIFLSFTLLLVTLTSVLGFVGLRFAQNLVTDSASNELRVLSISLSEQVEHYMRHVETDIKYLEAHGELINEMQRVPLDKAKIEEFLKDRQAKLKFLDGLTVFDKTGAAVASTDPDWNGYRAKHEPFFTNGLKRFYVGEVLDTIDEGKMQLISAPITDGVRTLGVLVAQVSLSNIYELMDQKLGLSGQSEAFLVDSQLRFITPGKSGPEDMLQSHLADTPLEQHLKENFWVGHYKNYRGNEVLGTVRHLAGYDWYLAVEHDYGEVQKNLVDVKRTWTIVTVALMIAVLLTTFILTRSITRPLLNLVKGVQLIAEGNFGREFRVPRGSDEVAFLAAEFENMRAKIAASQGQLIARLEESEQRRIESERLAAIGTLAASLAHEIRNPLNAISLLLAQIERWRGTTPLPNASIQGMRSEIGRLDRLISDILDYARPLQLVRTEFDLGDLLRGLLDLYRGVFEQRHIQCRFDTISGPTLIQGDRDKVKQAFVNLLQNAIEALPSSGGMIEVVLAREAAAYCVVIRDNGMGIPEKARARLFDLFFTTKERGTGLGLSNVRKIVDAHGGSITIESFGNDNGPKGTGTVVRVVLPSQI